MDGEPGGPDPWSGKLLRAVEQLSPCTTSVETRALEPGATATEPACPRARALQQEKLLQ